MTASELREKYLRFFESKGHTVHPSGSLIPYDVTGRLDESLLFNGAGMVQFKPYFRGVAEPENKRLTTAQKCVRTGDIEEVGDLTHLTFFEMMGNFSFGDYFKADAIAYSWEFLTSPEWLGLEPHKLSFTVYEEDDEAFAEWSKWVSAAGIDPATRIFRLGEETNYWPAGAFSNGPPGPCGPNTEMFYWVADSPPPSGPYTREDWQRDDKLVNWLEIWNDVFIQFEWQGRPIDPAKPSLGYEKLGMPSLPFRSVDTGMGLERTAAALGGHKSLYDIDIFRPIISRIEAIGSTCGTGVAAASGDGDRDQTAANHGRDGHDTRGRDARATLRYGENEAHDVAIRIIADHIRTAVFCIADGVLPGNTGRGYVLRRLIRRAVLKGQRGLGFEQPFFHLVFDGVIEAMGGHYRELTERYEVISETLRNEEALFRRTVASGSELLQDELDRLGKRGAAVLPGATAFKLYDTYGFPLEVTMELAKEAGIEVDEEGYEAALKEAQERSRASDGRETVYGSVTVTLRFVDDEGKATPTEFEGYETCATRATIVGALPEPEEGGNAGKNLVLALDRTPFYAESGGQVGDVGIIRGDGFEGRVLDVIKQDGVFIHEVEPIAIPQRVEGMPMEGAGKILQDTLFGKEVEAVVDQKRRASIMRNHTATHLLHAALRSTLGKHVTQAGSYVGPDRLRFDFTHGKAMTPDEIATVERIVNEKALENLPIRTYVDLPIDMARAMGAMALFGEKYGDFVRLVQVGDEPPEMTSFSRELCGGTHVRSTGEIGLFKVVSEASAASGVRRIEAITGEGAYQWVLDQERLLREAAARLKASPRDLVAAVDRAIEAQRDLKQKLEKARAQGSAGDGAQIKPVGSVELAVQKLTDSDQGEASRTADRLAENQPNRVVIVGLAGEGKVTLVSKVGADALRKGAHAGNLVRELAKLTGGGGGGRPDFATAGGKQPEKLDEALAAAEGLLAGMLGGQ